MDKWEARIRRSIDLASTYPFAAEVLCFYERVTRFQQAFYIEIKAECGTDRRVCTPGSLLQELDLILLLPRFAAFLALIEDAAPNPLAQAAGRFRNGGPDRWRDALIGFWRAASDGSSDPANPDSLISWVFLQPYAEYLADHSAPLSPYGTPHRCPLCGAKPLAGVLRPEGDGSKRSLVCSLCSKEWEYRRIVCPSCGDENVEKLAVYVTEHFPHIRVEACDSCRCYIKTVDLTKSGHAVPVVDELAAIPLSLWAQENGYTKVTTNLAGI